MRRFEKIIDVVSHGADKISQVALVVLMLIGITEITLRAAWKPLQGSYDMITVTSIIVICFALARCGRENGFTSVQLIVNRMPKKLKKYVGIFTDVLGLALYTVASWQCFVYASYQQQANDISRTAGIPFYPFTYSIGVSIALLCAVLLFRVIKSVIYRTE